MKLSIIFFILISSLIFSHSAYSKGKITFIKDAVDTSAGDLACYKIITPNGIFFLEKEGLGLSSMLDREGVDWISHHPKQGSKSNGEYRGFPNAVNNQDGSFFHPYNGGTQPSSSHVIKESKNHISIKGVSGNNAWHCQWDFYTTHCKFTMTKMPAGYKYWVLYEGTPGGKYDDSDYYMISAQEEQIPLTTYYDHDIPAPEWIAFGDRNFNRILFMANHKDDKLPDKFWQMNKQMTVFGFGRDGLTKFFDVVPREFSIGFIESADHRKINKELHKIVKFE